MSVGVYGDTTRKLYSIWLERFPSNGEIDVVSRVQSLFNAINLFPSQSQVFDMLHCCDENQSEISRNEKIYLTFGEFCVYATELRMCYLNYDKSLSSADSTTSRYEPSRTSSLYNVFLGGSCNPTTWREDIAIPYLNQNCVTYYNPQQLNWEPRMMELEEKAKETSQLLFFVLTDVTRNVASMIEICYFVGKRGKDVIVTINSYSRPGHVINGDPMSAREFVELSNAQITVQDIIERQGMPVFSNIDTALSCTTKLLKEHTPLTDLGLQDNVQPVKLPFVQFVDKLAHLREEFDSLDTKKSGKICLRDVRMVFRIHTQRNLSHSNIEAIIGRNSCDKRELQRSLDATLITFDQFCCIMSEFKPRNSHSSIMNKICKVVSATTPAKFAVLLKEGMKFNGLRRCRTDNQTISNSSYGSSLNSVLIDVYLGGSVDTVNWREELAINKLKKNGITYCLPDISSQHRHRIVGVETKVLESVRVLLFVVLSVERGVGLMSRMAYYVGLSDKQIVICVQKISDCTVCIGEDVALSPGAIKDYNRGRDYLSDIAKRNGVPVFENIDEAIDCVISKCIVAR